MVLAPVEKIPRVSTILTILLGVAMVENVRRMVMTHFASTGSPSHYPPLVRVSAMITEATLEEGSTGVAIVRLSVSRSSILVTGCITAVIGQMKGGDQRMLSHP